MKRIFSVFFACVLIFATAFSLVSCGGLSGTYEGTGLLKAVELKFSGNKVTVSVDEYELDGSFKITEDEDGNKKINFDFIDEEEASEDEKKVLTVIDVLLDNDLPITIADDSITISKIIKFVKKN